MTNNQAAWLDGINERLRVGEIPMPAADPGRVIVRVQAAAVNPVDWVAQDTGLFIKSWPFVLGEDVAGEVIEVGEGVTNVKKGDRVLSHADNFLMPNLKPSGGFALYSSMPAVRTAVLPSSLTYADASVLPLAFDTAITGLYSPTSDGFLGLPLPTLSPSPSGNTIIVWGGSSSVGATATQLAVASGVKVIATASPHNFDFCKKCGATEVINHRSASVVDDLVQAVKATGGSFSGIYDAISRPQSFESVLPVLEKLGGGNITIVLPPPENFPSSVKPGYVYDLSPHIYPLWKDYITKALESGQLKCLPEPLVIGKGLDNVQKGLDENKKGVSAKKVVVEL